MGKGKKGKILWSIAGFFIGAGGLNPFGTGAAGMAGGFSGGLMGASLAGTLWSTFNKQKYDDLDTGSINRFDKVMNTVSSTATIPVIYGERKWAGNQTYHKTNAEQNTLRKHIVLCESDIEGVVSVSANDLLISTGGATNGTVFTVQNVKYQDATVMIKNKWMTLYANGKTTQIYLADKNDYERTDLYDYNTSVSSLVSYINRLGEGWQAYPTASTNSYPGELYELSGVNINYNPLVDCPIRTKQGTYCPDIESSYTYEVSGYLGAHGQWMTETREATACQRTNNECYREMSRAGAGCYNNPQNAKAPTVRGDTSYTFHNGDCPDTYLETGSYKKCSWIDLNLTVSDELSGNPNITCIVKGKKVLDTRTGQVVYSTNPAMCLRDFILSKRYGTGWWVDSIDENSFKEVADYCDELIQYKGINVVA